jgi:radical SAM superfamily enzyme YgiQ (UPF0313 family)
MKKVFLIRLSRHSYELTVVPPLGVMYLASVLRAGGGHTVTIYDMKVEGESIEEATKRAIEFGPDVVGLSLMSFEAPVLSRLATSIKQALPKAFIIAGGPHPSTFPQDIASEPDIDMFVLGEGEMAFSTILERIEQGGSLNNIEGTAVRIDGKAKITPRSTFIADLDTLPMPAWDLIPLKKYFDMPRMGNIYKYKEFMPIFTSRSCPFQCVYCHKIFGKGFRPRSPESVLEEIKFLYQQYHIREFMIMDDCFNLQKPRAHEILSRIASSDMDICLRFPNGMRADILDRDMVVALKEANTFATCVAVETATPRLQKMIKKNLDLDKVFEIIELTDRYNIMTHGFFMIGFPTETKEEMLATIDYAVRSKLHSAAIFRVTPFKGTELYQMALDMGYQVADDPDSFEIYKTHINLSTVPEEDVTKLQNLFYRRFYLNLTRQLRFLRLMPNKMETIPRLAKIFFSRAFR